MTPGYYLRFVQRYRCNTTLRHYTRYSCRLCLPTFTCAVLPRQLFTGCISGSVPFPSYLVVPFAPAFYTYRDTGLLPLLYPPVRSVNAPAAAYAAQLPGLRHLLRLRHHHWTHGLPLDLLA